MEHSELKRIEDLEKQLEQMQQEYMDLMESKTLSSMTGDIVIKSRKSVKGLVTMPFQILKLRKRFLNGEFRPKVHGFSRMTAGNPDLLVEKDAVMFMATNGVGLGHLTRCLSVARRMKDEMGVKKIVFLTTCPALHLIRNEGFIPFYVPSKVMFKNDITSSQWDELLMSAFQDMFALYQFGTIVFDGAIPYQSLAMVLENNTDINRVWIRRGSAKKSAQASRQNSEVFFDHVIIPAEAGDEVPVSYDKYEFVKPIVYLNDEEQMDRADVRKIFGVGDDQKLIYVQLGAGKINNTENVLDTVLEILLEDKKNKIVIGQSPLGDELNYVNERIQIIKDYPNAKYFKGLDLAVSACGYNSFHELLYTKVPTVFLPNTKTGTDDQVARALRSEAYGLGAVVTEPTRENIAEAVQKMMQSNIVKEDIVLDFHGATEAANVIMKYHNEK